MRFMRPLLALAVSAGLALAAPAGLAAAPKSTAQKAIQQKKKKHHHHYFAGTVVKVHHNKQKKGHGWIKVRVHHHHAKTAAAQAAPAKPAKKGATAASLTPKKGHHTVKVHVHPPTKYHHVVKGLVQGKAQVKTVGSGKNKTKVAVPGKLKMATKQIPAHFSQVKKGQHVHIHRKPGHHYASHVKIIHPSAQKKIPSPPSPSPWCSRPTRDRLDADGSSHAWKRKQDRRKPVLLPFARPGIQVLSVFTPMGLGGSGIYCRRWRTGGRMSR